MPLRSCGTEDKWVCLEFSRLAIGIGQPGIVEGKESFGHQLSIMFQPNLNEELAATAVQGAQIGGIDPAATVKGVLGLQLTA